MLVIFDATLRTWLVLGAQLSSPPGYCKPSGGDVACQRRTVLDQYFPHRRLREGTRVQSSIVVCLCVLLTDAAATQARGRVAWPTGGARSSSAAATYTRGATRKTSAAASAFTCGACAVNRPWHAVLLSSAIAYSPGLVMRRFTRGGCLLLTGWVTSCTAETGTTAHLLVSTWRVHVVLLHQSACELR